MHQSTLNPPFSLLVVYHTQMASTHSDLETAWTEACAKFQKATGYDLSAPPKVGSADDLVRMFEDAKIKDEEEHERLNKAKTAVRHTFEAVEQIGNIAAQGVSMVFGSPATITMSCISFVIDAGLAYKDIAHNIEDLFSRIVRVLDRFQLYRDNAQYVKDPMVRIAHRLLLAIVSICERCIKMMNPSKTNKVKKFFHVALFSDDGGIKDQFEVLETLEKEEAQMAGTLTLIASERNQQANANVLKEVMQLKESNTEEKILKEVTQYLGVDIAASKKEYDSSREQLVPGTCAWLQDDLEYKSWSNITQEGKSLLVLHGEEGCGKSYTATAILRDLHARYSQYRHSTTRIFVAYSYLTRGGKTDAGKADAGKTDASNSKRTLSIRDVIREWALQIVGKDELYRKKVLAIYKQSSDLSGLVELWQKLFVDLSGEEFNFYLSLDGTHELDERNARDLLALVKNLPSLQPKRGRIRIVLTARSTLIQRLVTVSSNDITVMDMREKSSVDMEKYIRDKANNLSIFQETSREIQDLKDEVCRGLVNAVNGNFLSADIKLDEISRKNDFEEVRQIVNEMEGSINLEETVVAQLRECNRFLTAREMEDLNALFLWIIYGKWSFSVAELEAALRIQHGRKSLQPLAKQIKEKFSAFLELSTEDSRASADVSLKYDSIADYFQTLSDQPYTSDTSSSNNPTKGEIRMAQHFIQKLCDDDIYMKLGFKEFFDQKLSRSETGIAVDCENAEANLALLCMRIITTDIIDEENDIALYAICNITSHLKEIDLDRINPRLKAELGSPLIRMFRDPHSIRRSNKYAWRLWSYYEDEVQDVLRLLRSSAVTKKIDADVADNQQWVDRVLGESNPKLALLKDSAVEMAQVWLSSSENPKIMAGFCWLYGYVNKVSNIISVMSETIIT